MRPSLVCAAGVTAAVVGHTSTTCSAFGLYAARTVIPSSVSSHGGLTAISSAPGPSARQRTQRVQREGGACLRSWASRCNDCSRGGGQKQQPRSSTLAMSAGRGAGEKRGGGVTSGWMESGKKWLAGVALASTLLAGTTVLSPTLPSFAATGEETKEIGLCLLGQCRGELASCLLNPKCFANIICLQTCNGRPDEGYCQIRCGDLFENEAVGKFNACAVSKKNCVKQRQDDGSWPVPPIASQAKSFNTKLMEGQWYISAGLNSAFDCFDCQVHFFNSPKPGKLVGKLNWRIKEPDGEFFTRDVVQQFTQDTKNPAHLVNKDNEYLHYRDDWYILDSEPNSHVLVVYRGSNDAWDGYGGGTLYTKDKSVPPALVERLKAKSEAAGIEWSRWKYNDNTCKPQTSETSELLREKYAKKLLLTEGEQLQEQLTAVRGYAVQEAEDVEASALVKLEELKQDYEVEVEQLGTDLVAAFEAELSAFEGGVSGEAKTIADGAVRIEKEAESIFSGKR